MVIKKMTTLKKSKEKNFKFFFPKGALAKGMKIDENNISKDEKKKFDDGWTKYAFNNYASSLIPMNRTIPDIRLPG